MVRRHLYIETGPCSVPSFTQTNAVLLWTVGLEAKHNKFWPSTVIIIVENSRENTGVWKISSIFGSDNGLSPARHQAIVWPNNVLF